MTMHPRVLDDTDSDLESMIPDESELTAGTRIEPGRSYGFFTDTTLCIGCKACEVACKEWNALPADDIGLTGMSYDNTGRLSANSWRHVAFIEQISEDGERVTEMAPFQSNWLMMSDVCKHCANAPCLEACPTGAIFRTQFYTVQQDICNGCGYCVPTCPFSVVELSEVDGSFFLTGFGPTSALTAAGQFIGERSRSQLALRAAKLIQLPAAAAGAGMSSYTGALLSATSTPLWSAAPRLLSARFACSAMATAAASLSLLECWRGSPENCRTLASGGARRHRWRAFDLAGDRAASSREGRRWRARRDRLGPGRRSARTRSASRRQWATNPLISLTGTTLPSGPSMPARSGIEPMSIDSRS
jgi:Fe-S-cluster-containing dehydrogenase component